MSGVAGEAEAGEADAADHDLVGADGGTREKPHAHKPSTGHPQKPNASHPPAEAALSSIRANALLLGLSLIAHLARHSIPERIRKSLGSVKHLSGNPTYQELSWTRYYAAKTTASIQSTTAASA